MPASRTRTAATAAGGLAVLLAAGSLAAVLGQQRSGTGPDPSRITAAAFTTFPDCGALLDYYRDHGRQMVGPYGLPDAGSQYLSTDGVAKSRLGAPAPGTADSAVPKQAGPDQAGPDQAGPNQAGTGTNVQVAGVDEADVAKQAGNLLLTVGSPPDRLFHPMDTETAPDATSGRTPTGSGGGTAPVSRGPALRILRTDGTRATLVGVLPTTEWSADRLLVQKTTVLLLGTPPVTPATTPNEVPARSRDRTRIAQVDIADPAHPRLLRTLDVDGTLVGARLSTGVVRLAVSSPPGDLHLVTPPEPGTGSAPAPRAPGSPAATPTPTTTQHPTPTTTQPSTPTTTQPSTQQSLEANRRIIGESTLDSWLPRYTLAEGASRSAGTLVDCAKVAAPAEFSGLETLSLLSFDLGTAAGIGSWQAAGVVASGTTLYATTDRAYVATSPWQSWNSLSGDRLRAARQRQRTWIHAFTTVGSGEPHYLASGSVPGFLLNQYALDEYHGDLRVASTQQPTWLAPAPDSAEGPTSKDSTPGSDALPPPQPDVATSQVTVLRPDGDKLAVVGQVGGIGRDEQIRGVRFIGPVGYVVTFRQTDPLFTVDLSDPALPRVAGELKLLGYSAYLHPAGEHLLLGVGQSSDAHGVRQGLQLSLFDVADPGAPRRVTQVVLPDAVSDVESDAHAFTFADGLVLLPYTRTLITPGTRLAPEQPLPDGTATIAPRYLVDTGVVAVRLTGGTLSAPAVLRPLGPTATTPRGTPSTTMPSTTVPSTTVPSTTMPSTTMPSTTVPPQPAPLRTFVSNAIWTITADGVAAHQQSTLRWLSFTRFAR